MVSSVDKTAYANDSRFLNLRASFSISSIASAMVMSSLGQLEPLEKVACKWSTEDMYAA